MADASQTTEAQTEEIEINFRLDENGRTAPTTTTMIATTATPLLDYRSQTVQTSFRYNNNDDDDDVGKNNSYATDKTGNAHDKEQAENALLDELLLDCEIADSGLMPRTFWVPADGSPRCTLEQMALDVFRHHVPYNAIYDRATSGAEWWVQIRPSPPSGRYAMHAKEDLDDEISQLGIWFHWDKDEDLRQIMGGDTTYIHPHLSTVTYLTGLGAPTLAINRRIHPLTGEWIPQDNIADEAWISWPRYGKHLSFDGRFLHAAPPNLLPAHCHNALASSTTTAAVIGSTPLQQRKLARRQRRVTFLVNIWLNHHPLNVNPFPASMIDKLSGNGITGKRGHLVFGERYPEAETFHQESGVSWQVYQWPMGGCDSGDQIALSLPIDSVQRQHASGGNSRVVWISGDSDSVQLTKLSAPKRMRLDC